MTNQTLQERQQGLFKQQEALLKKRDKINQDLKEVKKKIEDSEKDYLMEFLKDSKMTIHEAIEKLKSNIDNQNHYQ